MIYYVRVINSSKWIAETDEEIPGEAITFYLQAKDNEWSVYRIEADSMPDRDDERLKSISLRTALLKQNLYAERLSLFFIEENWIVQQGWTKPVPDESKDGSLAGQLHYEIADVTLNKISALAEYILQNLETSIEFEKADLLKIINERFEESYLVACAKNKTSHATGGQLRDAFKTFNSFKDSDDPEERKNYEELQQKIKEKSNQ